MTAAAPVLVVVPTYNESANLRPLVLELLDLAAEVHVLVVDDNSPDGTGAVADELCGEQPGRVHCIHRPGKLGLGTAHIAGFDFGVDRDYARVVTMDGDRSHSPRYIPELLTAMERFDMVIGSRYMPGGGLVNWPLHRRLLSVWANFFTRLLLRLPVADCTSGYRCYSREVLETVEPDKVRGSGYSFLEQMVWKVQASGFRVGEVPIIFEDRYAGASKIDKFEVFRAAWHVLATAVAPPRVPKRQVAPPVDIGTARD
jgi:glycosyltransferase involved in cell wall biosynthesis